MTNGLDTAVRVSIRTRGGGIRGLGARGTRPSALILRSTAGTSRGGITKRGITRRRLRGGRAARGGAIVGGDREGHL